MALHRSMKHLLVLILLIVTEGSQFLKVVHGQPFFRSRQSGNWNVPATWDSAGNAGGPWFVAVINTPGISASAIIIQTPHTVRITASASADDITVNGLLRTTGTSILTINDGATQVDLQINGTFEDSSTSNITFSGSARWALSATGTLVKYTSSACNNWQLAYDGGIANIPATAHWIHRRTSAASPPSISTTAGIAGAYYPNLTIENYVAGTWDCDALSSTCFNGVAGFPTIKGNFDIGGSSPAGCYVRFMNKHTNAGPTKVQGQFIINSGHIYSNHGTGTETQSDVQVDGIVNYATGQTPKFNFTGTANQLVTGSGAFNIYDMQVNKGGTGELTLSTTLTVSNLLTLSSGIINTSVTNLIVLDTAASVASAGVLSFINGPVRKLGSTAFTFPTGKKISSTDKTYKPFGVTSGGNREAIWTEGFNNGCSSGCLASAYSGVNGAWTLTDLGPTTQCGAPVEKNEWFVSCAENGNAVGACGTGCGSNATLHVGSLSTSPNSVFYCPTGDCGAAYDAGGYCGLLSMPPSTYTEKRIQSPVINLAGKRSLQITFKYIEFGEGSNDNATLWYYDGSTWSQLADMPKTLCGNNVCATGTCGTGPVLNPYAQGVWTQITYSLPASLNNNPNAKIGFTWKNDDNGTGSDPSFAVDDVQITEPVSFTCEYFDNNPQTVFNNNLQAGIDHISACEYWNLNNNSGTANKQVTLTWDTYSCGVTDLNDLRVVRWDSTNYNPGSWRNHGKGATTGTTSAGTVASVIASNNTFGPYTLASSTSDNPLPVELLYFNASKQADYVMLEWKTASEINSHYFEVERSKNAVDFKPLFMRVASGSSGGSNYSGYDMNPYNGVSYYRLKQVDHNGTFQLSKTVTVNFNSENGLMTCFYSGSHLNLQSENFNGSKSAVRIYDSAGHLIYKNNQQLLPYSTLLIPTPASGLYMVVVQLEDTLLTGRFFVY